MIKPHPSVLTNPLIRPVPMRFVCVSDITGQMTEYNEVVYNPNMRLIDQMILLKRIARTRFHRSLTDAAMDTFVEFRKATNIQDLSDFIILFKAMLASSPICT